MRLSFDKKINLSGLSLAIFLIFTFAIAMFNADIAFFHSFFCFKTIALVDGSYGCPIASFYDILLFGTACNIIVIILYSLTIFAVNRKSNAENQLKWSDSIYYMGFLLTLYSIILAFYKIKDPNQGELLKLTIVQNAVALSNTVAALFCRTIWRLSLPSQSNSPHEGTPQELATGAPNSDARNGKISMSLTVSNNRIKMGNPRPSPQIGLSELHTNLTGISGSVNEISEAVSKIQENIELESAVQNLKRNNRKLDSILRMIDNYRIKKKSLVSKNSKSKYI